MGSEGNKKVNKEVKWSEVNVEYLQSMFTIFNTMWKTTCEFKRLTQIISVIKGRFTATSSTLLGVYILLY
jgi:hypothetical protein